MSVSIGKGYDTTYMTDAVEGGRETYYTGADAMGEPAGLWHGAGAEALGLSGEVDAEQMTALFAHRIDPRDPAAANMSTWGEAATLGRKPHAFKNADQRYAALLEQNPDAGPELRAQLRAQAETGPGSVPFFDVTLSAPKSVTVLWVACERAANEARVAGGAARAAGDLARAGELGAQAREWAGRARDIEESLLVGHRAALDYLADKAGYVRAGHHGGGGGKWLDAHKLVTAQFLQHDSRDRDPQLHVHGPVLNLAEGPDGKWRRLDGQGIFREKAAASAIGDRTAEAELARRRGVRMETRPDGLAREVVGIDQEAMDLFSSRRQAIGPAAEKLMQKFRDENGREPNGLERHKLYQRATLATRARKSHHSETRDGQMRRWADKAQSELGRDLVGLAEKVFGQAPVAPAIWSETDVIERALAAVSESKQAWTRSDLIGHISAALPGNLGLPPEQSRELLEGLADKALASAGVLRVDHPAEQDQLPDEYHRVDGSSVFSRPASARRYATETQLRGEHELREAAVRRGAPVLSADKVRALVDRRAELQMPFNADQEAAIRGVLTSGAAVQVVCAPAGTGKSFLVGALNEAWEAGQVRGLAFGQRQADILTEEGVTSRNITHWLVGQQRLDEGRPQDDDEEFRLHRGDLLVVDEAQLAGNANLVQIAQRCEAAGAMLVLAGDAAQGGMGASGGLTDVAEHGVSYELAEVRRFNNGWEGPASLRLRDGDTSVVADYAKHGRLVDAGSIEQAEAAAARAWLADTLNGHESLVITASNKGAARVCAQLRAELVSLGRVEETGVELRRQGTTAGVGDLIQARHADRKRDLVNRALFRVTEVLPDGGLGVVPVKYEKDGEVRGTPRTIPADYVRDHVALGYASTGAAAIGRTVYSGYPILAPGMDAADSYVDITRGAATNVAFIVTQSVPTEDAQSGETARATRRSAEAVFAELITRPDLEIDQTRTATTQHEQAEEVARATGSHVDPMTSVIADITAGQAGAVLDQLAAENVLAAEDRLALAADPAMGTVEQLLRTAELAGHDPAVVLRDAVSARDFNHAISPAQVLHSRIRAALEDQLTPDLTSYADLLPTSVPEGLQPALEDWAAAADDRRFSLGAELAENPPQWAREALGPVPQDPLDRADWEQKAGWAASYREWAGLTDDADALGAAPPAGLGEKYAVWETAHAALGLVDVAADEEKCSVGELRNRVAAYERELNWAPRYVADELAATHAALRRLETDATVWAARAEATTSADERQQLLDAAADAREQVETLGRQVEQLEMADHARGAWYAETAITREYATRARAALDIRGVDLDSPTDRVTAEEWLDAHSAEQAEADQYREIHDEADLYEPTEAGPVQEVQQDGLRSHDEPAEDVQVEQLAEDVEDDGPARPARDHDMDSAELGTDLPDIRATSTPDESERVDPAERRRVPQVDETASTVERAQSALAEIDDRQGWDATSAAHAATEEPEESVRAVELNRWATDDQVAEDADTMADA